MRTNNFRCFPPAVRIVASVALLLFFCLSGLTGRSDALAQSLSPFDRDSARDMLIAVRDDIKKNYYDPALHGIDLDTRFKQAEERIKQAQTRDQLMVTVAQALLDFNDSHTFFVPPSRAARVEYGWRMQTIGDKCYVVAIKPKSDAQAKGLRLGDEVLAVDRARPTRDNLWKMYYRYYALSPSRSMRLVVQSPGDAQPRELDVQAKVEMGQSVRQWDSILVQSLREEWGIYQDRFYEVGADLLVWKMPTFTIGDEHVDAVMGRARKFKTLVIDLRGNGGGYVDALARLTGHFFERDLKVADLKGRKEMKPVTAKTRGDKGFKGQLIVLVDSDSGSASELFARIIQLEKRGTVIGDRSAGAVMTSRFYDHQTGVGSVLYFGASVTIADLIMSDGKSLEKVGVTPDELILPAAIDLASQRDPVLTRAAALAGVKLDAEKAGTLFPLEWRK